ncbi:unnamed protein product, partial [Aphanomyces euteiches]
PTRLGQLPRTHQLWHALLVLDDRGRWRWQDRPERRLGYYLSRCNNCAYGASYPDQAFVHVSDWKSAPWAQWTCEQADNGKIALKADSGKYLARCSGCVRSGPADVAFVHAAYWKDSPWAQFDVEYLSVSTNQSRAAPAAANK